jgi:4-amino-4-deoxy-L-arabinose transferase-like glycosyltransferase
VLATGLCLWGQPWHIDEPFFLAIARQILRDPWHPLSFAFNWYGWSEPMASINNTPPLLAYLLAGALKFSGGGEFWTRACFFPFDLAAAWGLLALAARFLRRPLWPTLVVLAGPGWALNLPHVMAERVMAGFAFPALWLAITAFDEDDSRAFWASAALAALAILSKYNALFVIPPVVVYARARSWKRLALWTVAASGGLVVSLIWSRAVGGTALRSIWSVTSASAGLVWSCPSHRLRALLAFTGGLGLPAAVFLGGLRLERRALLAAAAACALLFGPWFDLAAVRPLDRAAGFLFAWGALAAAWAALRRPGGSAPWAAWALAVAVLQLAYWSVVARFVVFLLPPLVYGLWERLESSRPDDLDRLGRTAFCAALVMSVALGVVDWTYAAGQKNAAAAAVTLERPRGGTVWYSGHWGLQEYLSVAGARQLDVKRGGWDEARPGDLVVVSEVNANRIAPKRPTLSDIVEFPILSPIPLRLLGDRRGEAGFYTSGMGFLPWTFSRSPVDEFSLVELR